MMTKQLVIMVMLVPALLGARTGGQERYIFDESTRQWTSYEETETPVEGVVGEARDLVDRNKIGPAEKILKKYLKACNGDEPDRPEAMLLYADCAFMRGEYGSAEKRYRELISAYPNTREYAISLRREMDIAKAWLAGKRKRVLGIFFFTARDDAIDILTQIEQLAGGYRIAEVALWTKADYYFRDGQFELAEISFQRLAKDYKSPRYHKIAMYRSASSAMAAFPGINFDDTPLLEATELYREYMDEFPNEARREDIPTILEQIRQKRAEKEFSIGKFYRRIRKPTAAAYYFRYVIKTWPDTIYAEQARLELEKMGFSIES